MLWKENVITRQVLNSVDSACLPIPKQREVLLAAVRGAVQTNYILLQKFADVLCKFTGNVQLGTAIQREYGKLIFLLLCYVKFQIKHLLLAVK